MIRTMWILWAIGLGTLSVQADMLDEFEKIDTINEGDLVFIHTHPTGSVLHQVTNKTLTEESLRSGWIKNDQCFYNLDPVELLQVVYRRHRVRQLRITRSEQIGKSWVEGHTVQLEQVGKDSVLCLQSEVRGLEPEKGKQSFLLSAGPFMRRFLDGYFPMRVTLSVNYPQGVLNLVETLSPKPIGGTLTDEAGRLVYDALFEGQLRIKLRFARLSPD